MRTRSSNKRPNATTAEPSLEDEAKRRKTSAREEVDDDSRAGNREESPQEPEQSTHSTTSGVWLAPQTSPDDDETDNAPFSLPSLPLTSKPFLPRLSPLGGTPHALSAFFLDRPYTPISHFEEGSRSDLPPAFCSLLAAFSHNTESNTERDGESSSDSDGEEGYATPPCSGLLNPHLAPLTTTLSHCQDLSARCPPDHEPECAELVFLNLDTEQKRFMPDPSYVTRQPDISPHMRHILIDWLVEVADEFSLKSTTLFLTVSLIDRFLSRVNVNGEKLQIVGLAAMFIVSKVEEDCPPSLEEFVLPAENSITHNQVIETEKEILNAVKFSVIAPTIHTFLRRIHRCCHVDPEALQLSNYLAELSLLNTSFLQFPPSIVAASAVALGQHSVDCVPWSMALSRASRHSFTDLETCMTELLTAFQDASTNADQKASRDKYTAPNPCLCVANIAPPDHIPTSVNLLPA